MSDFDYRTGDKIEINLGEWEIGVFESYKPFPDCFLCNIMQMNRDGTPYRMITNIPLNCIRKHK